MQCICLDQPSFGTIWAGVRDENLLEVHTSMISCLSSSDSALERRLCTAPRRRSVAPDSHLRNVRVDIFKTSQAL
ncbi:hypothetical protein AXFE_04390 [Acidithrix ferrooxidans]|uniref:Uncharacterized protein n=1 Tax=Acidithrix ferrooxidans TaxID=1280514 RepID=A0A0D8HL57_9ACTN|nr:hypothetical protein AXFE_04390 [Acidithrix ferrooxidans]